MKPSKTRQLTAILITALCVSEAVAQTTDFKTINPVESYIAGGQQIVLRQNPGEAVVKLGQSGTEFYTAHGRFVETRPLGKDSAMFTLQAPAQATGQASQSAVAELNRAAAVLYAYPVFVNAATGRRVFLNDEVVVSFKETPEDPQTAVDSELGLKLVETLSAMQRMYVYRLSDPKNANPFRICQALLANKGVAWAEPNLAQEGRSLGYPPNDTLLSLQWYVRNIGQTGAASGADAKAYDAWVGENYGSPGIRIAILDSGLDTGHADLAANIVAGYDFKDGDNNPGPANQYDNHGTAVAAVAAAVVDNNEGIAGIAGKCTILPVRVASTQSDQTLQFPSVTEIYRALVYAADNADVLNCSWELGSQSTTVSNGFYYASSLGRGGLGCSIFVAAGNDAAGHGAWSWEDIQILDIYSAVGAGNFRVEFSYEKDSSGSDGDDAVWLAEIWVPLGGGYTAFTFDDGNFGSWTPGGNAGFFLDGSDPEHTHGTSQYALRSGNITHNQTSKLESPLITITSDNRWVFFRRWMSSANNDVLQVYLKNSGGSSLGSFNFGGNTVAARNTAVSYPANLVSLGGVYAVGASTDFDYRAEYSAIGASLDFLAPSAGGFASPSSPAALLFTGIEGIVTADRSGADGYIAGDYTWIWPDTTPVGGTSISAAIASGVAGLVLSKNGNQTGVGGKMITTCDKIGPVTYTGSAPNTRNDFYGHGRLNADAAVDAVSTDSISPQFSSITVVDRRTVDVVFSEPMGESALVPTNYEITAGKNTLSDNPDHVVRLGLVSSGFAVASSIYRLIWDSDDIATSGTVTIAADSGIEDVAGNSLTGTLSRSGTGMKRQIGVDCGSGDEFRYKAPFRTDNKFQGNEAAPAYLTSGGSYIEADYGTAVDTSGLTDPAPQVVYQSRRVVSNPYDPEPITYEFSGMPSSNNKVRVHITNISSIYQYEVFDIYINASYKATHYAGGTAPQAHIKEYTGIGLNGSGKIQVQIVPQQSGYDSNYRASVSGIEVVQP